MLNTVIAPATVMPDLKMSILPRTAKFVTNDNRIHYHTKASADVSFVRFTQALDATEFKTLFLAGSTEDMQIDLFETSIDGFYGNPNRKAHKVATYVAPGKVTCISDAKRGFASFGCKNGHFGLFQVYGGNSYKVETIAGSVELLDDALTTTDANEYIVVYGSLGGKLFVDTLGEKRQRRVFAERMTIAYCTHAYSSDLILTGHDDGSIMLWDLRVANTENNGLVRKFSKVAAYVGDSVTTVDMKGPNLVAAGTSRGTLRFADLRGGEDQQCQIALSHQKITGVKFSEVRNNLVLVTAVDGYLELDNRELMSDWWNASNPQSSPWLKSSSYSKIQMNTVRALPNLTSLDHWHREVLVSACEGRIFYSRLYP